MVNNMLTYQKHPEDLDVVTIGKLSESLVLDCFGIFFVMAVLRLATIKVNAADSWRHCFRGGAAKG